MLNDHFCPWRLRSMKNLELVTTLAQTILGRITDSLGGKNAKAFIVVRYHLERDRTIRLGCRVRPAALFPKGIFETLANTRADELATIHGARHRCGSIFEAISLIQPTLPNHIRLFSAGTRHSPITRNR